MRHAHLKMGILLHKQATVRFILILAVSAVVCTAESRVTVPAVLHMYAFAVN